MPDPLGEGGGGALVTGPGPVRSWRQVRRTIQIRYYAGEEALRWYVITNRGVRARFRTRRDARMFVGFWTSKEWARIYDPVVVNVADEEEGSDAG